jgi:hypothetical protein
MFLFFQRVGGERRRKTMLDWLRLRLFGAGSPSPPKAFKTKSSCDMATQTDGELLLLLRQQAVREGGDFFLNVFSF